MQFYVGAIFIKIPIVACGRGVEALLDAVRRVQFSFKVDALQRQIDAFVVPVCIELVDCAFRVVGPVCIQHPFIDEVVDFFQDVVVAVGGVEPGKDGGCNHRCSVVVVEENPKVGGVQSPGGVAGRPTNLGFGCGKEVLTAHLENVQFASFVAVGDLLLEFLRVAWVETDLLAGR